MFRFVALVLVGSITLAKAEEALPLPASEETAPVIAVESAPAAAEPNPLVFPGLSGLARAEQLLKYAAEHRGDPKAGDAEREALALVTAARAGDDALVAAMQPLFDRTATDRLMKLEALITLGDPRSLNFVAYLARLDRDRKVREAAVAGLAQFGTAGEPPLKALALDQDDSSSMRVSALRALARVPTTTAADTLERVAKDGDESDEIRTGAFEALRIASPERAAAMEQNRVITSSGRGLFTALGALSGGYTLSLVGTMSASPTVGASAGSFGGLILGGIGANLLARSYPVSRMDALYMASAAAWSSPLGTFLGSTTGGPTATCSPPQCTAVMLATHAAAMTGSWFARRLVAPDLGDVVEINLVAASTLVMTTGALLLPTPTGDERPAMALLGLAPAAGFIAASAFAKKLHLTPTIGAAALIAAGELSFTMAMLGDTFLPTMTSDGQLLGQSVPNTRRSTQITGLATLGIGLGITGTLVASHWWQPTISDVALIGLGAIDAHLFAAGVPMLVYGETASDETWRSALTGVVGLGAAVGTGFLTKKLDLKLERGDLLFVTLGQTFLLVQTAGWTSIATENSSLSPYNALGLTLTATALGGIGLVAAAQKLDLPAWTVAWGYSGALWGGWIGGWSSTVGEWNAKDSAKSVLLGSALGLAATATLVSPLVNISPNTMAWASVGGVAGMTLGTLGAVFFAYDRPGHPVATANIVGTSIGLIGGGLLAHFLSPRPYGSGDDVGPELPGGLPMPMTNIGPATDVAGRVVPGMSAQLSWSL